MTAVSSLRYENRSEAIRELSAIYGRNSNYLKLRRDEFDALPFSSSSRNGWRNREPAKDVLEMGEWLRQLSFDELQKLVVSLVDNQKSTDNRDEDALVSETKTDKTVDISDENEIERVINATDENASIEIAFGPHSRRILRTAVIHNLKKLYHGYCQLCGNRPFNVDTVDICEAHHIEYFSDSHNNNASNIVIICPNHHRMIHKCSPSFDEETHSFIYSDGRIEPLKINFHL